MTTVYIISRYDADSGAKTIVATTLKREVADKEFDAVVEKHPAGTFTMEEHLVLE